MKESNFRFYGTMWTSRSEIWFTGSFGPVCLQCPWEKKETTLLVTHSSQAARRSLQRLSSTPGISTTATTFTWGKTAGRALTQHTHPRDSRQVLEGAVLHVESLLAWGTASQSPCEGKEATHSSYCSLLQIMARINWNIFVILFRNLIQSTNP